MRSIFLVAAIVSGSLCPPASGQDALQGKRLYLDAARIVGSTVSCVDCHGGYPPGLFGIGRAANNPAIVANALNTIPQMTPLRGRLSAQQIADVAAYLGNPGIPSPTLRTVPGDRLDFGLVAVGQSSTRGVLRLTNEGMLSLQLTSGARIVGTQAGDYNIADSTCSAGRSLAASESCEIGVIYRPSAGGLRTAALQIDHDWVSGTAAIALIGTADTGAANPPVSMGGGGGAVTALATIGLLFASAFTGSWRRRLARRCVRRDLSSSTRLASRGSGRR